MNLKKILHIEWSKNVIFWCEKLFFSTFKQLDELEMVESSIWGEFEGKKAFSRVSQPEKHWIRTLELIIFGLAVHPRSWWPFTPEVRGRSPQELVAVHLKSSWPFTPKVQAVHPLS